MRSSRYARLPTPPTFGLLMIAQSGRNSRNDEHNRKIRQLQTELESLRMQRGSIREKIVC
jgi:hypothetical protein